MRAGKKLVAGSVALVGLALLLLWWPRWPAQELVSPDRSSVLPAEAKSFGASGQARAAVPKFVALAAPPDEPPDEGPQEAAGRDDLGPGERAAVDRYQAQARAEAAREIGLRPAEATRLAPLRAESDARRARFEAQIDPRTGMLEPLATAAILANARTELRALERALGAARAAALRDAEAAAYRRLILGQGPDGGTGRLPAVMGRMLARRMLPVPRNRAPGRTATAP